MHTLAEPLPEALARALIARGYQNLTHVQRAVLSATASDVDLLVSAPPGTGKTLAYGIALARALLLAGARSGDGPRSLVIAPTRELAAQVKVELGWLVADAGIDVGLCVGGRDPEDTRELAGEVVVGSPGRLCDLLRRGGLDFKDVGWVILDEADELLRLGFREDVEFLLSQARRPRRSLMVSATVTPELERISRRHQPGRVRIDISAAPGARHATVREAMLVARTERVQAVVNLVRLHQPRAALIFCRRREGAAALAADLSRHGFTAACLSGALGQGERNAVVAGLRAGRVQVCVATDLAARGLDLPRLDLVVHADLPAGPEALVHRTGRTGRAGRPGRAVFLVARAQRARFVALMRRVGWRAAWKAPPSQAEIFAQDLGRVVLDPVFRGTASGREQAMAEVLMRTFSADRIAVACCRFWSGSLPAAGSVGDVPRARLRFGMDLAGVEARSMRPVLREIARRAAVPRADIGRVRRRGNHVEFELSAAAAAALAVRIARGEVGGILAPAIVSGDASMRDVR